MNEFYSCREAGNLCLETRRFAIAHLFHQEKTMDLHIHDYYEMNYSVSGGRKFLIDNQFYDIESGDLFMINNYESHAIAYADETQHERFVICLHPDYVSKLSDEQTDLSACFRRTTNASCRIHLTGDSQQRFLYLVQKSLQTRGFGQSLMENAAMTELLVLLNRLHSTLENQTGYRYHPTVDGIIRYINEYIAERFVLDDIAEALHLSRSYICKIFKEETGVTINKYIIARRVAIAKTYLVSGCTVTEVCDKIGAGNYANFITTFTRMVGISPKQYAKQHNG